MAKRPGLGSILVLSGWCGLVAGLIEVATIVVRKEHVRRESSLWHEPPFRLADPGDQPWPFLAAGTAGMGRHAWPRRAAVGWLIARVAAPIVPLPALLIAFPRIYTLAWLALTLGIALRLVPVLESQSAALPAAGTGNPPVALAILIAAGRVTLGE